MAVKKKKKSCATKHTRGPVMSLSLSSLPLTPPGGCICSYPKGKSPERPCKTNQIQTCMYVCTRTETERDDLHAMFRFSSQFFLIFFAFSFPLFLLPAISCCMSRSPPQNKTRRNERVHARVRIRTGKETPHHHAWQHSNGEEGDGMSCNVGSYFTYPIRYLT